MTASNVIVFGRKAAVAVSNNDRGAVELS